MAGAGGVYHPLDGRGHDALGRWGEEGETPEFSAHTTYMGDITQPGKQEE